ncbi:hypothetical protein [Mycobacteroides abscessus]|uniref:hypothetical protein n=1 Tax=Mycobacteroides abscessus TaxID=36809 RepID=UPI0005DB1FD8|nr:hypothetical protein [Mycobacteroides abscessus]MBE5508346.1 hypothetical protein [Mycobacteroides abscessus]MBN7384876.1 hypothetical protein [Mycobacteroides abscessus subsp. abscessus]MBN7414956.1 hypothetical protein [Mycobacteroides abscessus subsp. abscessus]MBN7485097.1 hypothetical protein [Mycobacteroides abscessus subsp. abscessus]MBN7499763.1 hypothetical protein [Mycobacteroides abscessus subsp. abscessus]
MVALPTRVALFAGAFGASVATYLAPIAAAQPPVPPVCGAGEAPYTHNCRTACAGGAPRVGGACTQPGTNLYDRGFHEPTHEGANPRTPLGTNPHVPYGTNTTTVLQ